MTCNLAAHLYLGGVCEKHSTQVLMHKTVVSVKQCARSSDADHNLTVGYVTGSSRLNASFRSRISFKSRDKNGNLGILIDR